MVEFANRLVARGHHVTFYLPDGVDMRCTWMRCDAAVKPMQRASATTLDVVLFNHEPQWHLLDRFERARRRVFYALHYGTLYGKEGSWESLRAAGRPPARQQQLDRRPDLRRDRAPPDGAARRRQPRGVPSVSRARSGTRCSAAASSSGPGRAPTRSSRRASCSAMPVERYSGKNLEQAALGREYAAARVFAVGSWFEGFCQPGLESLACGTPLVTTDNGGCREYAIDGETALVVPPRDARAMADAIRRLLDDDALAARLVANGLDVVDARLRLGAAHRRVRGRARRARRGPARRAAADPSGRARRARALGGRARVGQPPLHAAVRRLGAPQHRRAVRARDRRQRLGVGGRELRARRGRPRSCSTTRTSASRAA